MSNTSLLLIDLDGVILHRDDFFSNRAQLLYPNANHAAIKDFYVRGAYKQAVLGNVGLIETLESVLPSWNVDVGAIEIIETWFAGENVVDQTILDWVRIVRRAGIPCIIATDHSQYRKNDVWNTLGLKEYFDDIIASSDVGATKAEVAFYAYCVNKFASTNPSTITFIDDDPINVTIASECGLCGFVFTNNASLPPLSSVQPSSK